MDWPVLLTTSVLFALAFCVVFTAIVVGGVLAAPDAMVHDYPPAIRDRYGPKSTRGARVAGVMSVLMAALLLGTAVVGVLALRARLGGDVGFWDGFVFGFVVFLLGNLFDLVVLDWWLFCTVQPGFLVLPGTEGMAEYADKSFHWKVLVPGPIFLIPGYGVLGGGTAAVVNVLA